MGGHARSRTRPAGPASRPNAPRSSHRVRRGRVPPGCGISYRQAVHGKGVGSRRAGGPVPPRPSNSSRWSGRWSPSPSPVSGASGVGSASVATTVAAGSTARPCCAPVPPVVGRRNRRPRRRRPCRQRCPGSVASRAQAARTVADTVVTTMARPGKTAIHHELCNSCRPWATIRPQLTSGGWMPIPRKLSDELGQHHEAEVESGHGEQGGQHRGSDMAPDARPGAGAEGAGRVHEQATAQFRGLGPRGARIKTGIRATARTSTMPEALGENTYSTTTASSSEGKLRITSAIRRDTFSRQPPW